ALVPFCAMIDLAPAAAVCQVDFDYRLRRRPYWQEAGKRAEAPQTCARVAFAGADDVRPANAGIMSRAKRRSCSGAPIGVSITYSTPTARNASSFSQIRSGVSNS